MINEINSWVLVFSCYLILPFWSISSLSVYISVLGWPKIMRKFWMIVDFKIFLTPQESPLKLFWYGVMKITIRYGCAARTWTSFGYLVFETNITI